jgi:hypothetical protein
MFYLLLLLGFIAMAAGVFVGGFGFPIRETSFGAALLVVGSVAVTGGLILVGLAAAVRELQRVVQGLKARVPSGPRPARPVERREGERRNGERREADRLDSDRRPEARMPMPAAPGAEALNVIPTKLDASDTQERWREPAPEWLRRAMAEIEVATRPAEAKLAPHKYRTNDVRQPPDVWPRAAAPSSPVSASAEALQAPAVSAQNMFETAWPSKHRDPEGASEQQAEASPEIQVRPADAKSPPAAPDPPVAPTVVPASMRPPRAEPRQLPVLKSGVIDEMAYTLFSDGSIEAQMPDGTMRFASIEELRNHLQKHED